jgi:hypothetical protein
MMTCPCGEEIQEKEKSYSRSQGLNPLRCGGCLDVMFGKKWRVVHEVIEEEPEKLEEPPILEDLLTFVPDIVASVVREAQEDCDYCRLARKFGRVISCICMK